MRIVFTPQLGSWPPGKPCLTEIDNIMFIPGVAIEISPAHYEAAARLVANGDFVRVDDEPPITLSDAVTTQKPKRARA